MAQRHLQAMAEDSSIPERNSASTKRLTCSDLSAHADSLRAEIDPPWTGAALLAHIALWDRFARERWKIAAEERGSIPRSADDQA